MRAVIQRVTRAAVHVDNRTVSSIDRGLCVLVGISTTDTPDDMQYLIKKILSLRLFEKEGKPWAASVTEADLPVLCVSQFTLFAQTAKGRKPDFHRAMKSTDSQLFYEDFLKGMRKEYAEDKIFDGEFGAMMQVDIVNDGPVTILLDSRDK